MMGYSHTVSGAAGWLVLSELGVIQIPNTPTLIVTTLACAGAGVLPDIDHHNGSIARSIPPVSGWIARIVGLISGGHRKGTHSILGIIAFWAIAYFGSTLTYQSIPWLSLALEMCIRDRVPGMPNAPQVNPHSDDKSKNKDSKNN